MLNNPFHEARVEVEPHKYETRHYRKEVKKITSIFNKKFKELSKLEELAAAEIEDEIEGENEDDEGGPSPLKALSAQRSQAMGAASKRLSRGVALRFLLACKNEGFPMTVHLAKGLLAALFAGFGRSGISESTLVKFAGGGPHAQSNSKLNLGEIHRKIAKSGLIARHQNLLKKAKSEAEAIREGIKRG